MIITKSIALITILALFGCSKTDYASDQNRFRDLVRANEIDKVKEMIRDDYELRNDSNQETALHEAAGYGHLEIVKILITEEIEINQRNNQGMTALHMACIAFQSNVTIVKELLDSGADPLIKDNFEKTPLDYAIEFGYTDRIEALKTKHNQTLQTTSASARRLS